jgi:small subunit ribosomal protein S13
MDLGVGETLQASKYAKPINNYEDLSGGNILAEEGATPKDESKRGEKKEKGEKKESSKKAAPKKDESKKMDENFKYIVRLVNTDVDGNKPMVIGVSSVKGVGPRVADIIVKKAGVSRVAKIGTLDDAKVEQIEKLITTYADYAPAWAVNRQDDFETGVDMHIVGVDLEISLKDDINRMKMIRSYKGVRHELGQKVRGQRTRSNGRTGLTLGVMRQRQVPGGAPAEGGAAPAAAGAAPAAAAAAAPAKAEKPAAGGAKPAASAKPAAPAKPAAAEKK